MAVKLQKELVQIEYLWTLDTWEPTAFVINVESGVKHLKAPMSAITNVILGWKILNEEKALLWLQKNYSVWLLLTTFLMVLCCFLSFLGLRSTNHHPLSKSSLNLWYSGQSFRCVFHREKKRKKKNSWNNIN